MSENLSGADELDNINCPGPPEHPRQPVGLALLMPESVKGNAVLGLADTLNVLKKEFPGHGPLKQSIDSARMLLLHEVLGVGQIGAAYAGRSYSLSALCNLFPGPGGSGSIALSKADDPAYLELRPAETEILAKILFKSGGNPELAGAGFMVRATGNRPDMVTVLETGLLTFASAFDYPYLTGNI